MAVFDPGRGCGGRGSGPEDYLRGFGGEFPPCRRGAGLEDDRPALGRPGHVETAVDLEELALVVEHVELRRVEHPWRRLVVDEGVVLPGVPQRLDDLVGFARLFVALGVGRKLVEPEIARGVVVGAGHHVPGGPAMADVVERGEEASDVVGFVEAGRRGRAEADVGGRSRNGRKQRDRLHHVHVERRAAPGVEVVGARRGGVGQEEEVELALFGRLHETPEIVDVGRGTVLGAVQQPGRRMIPVGFEETTENHLLVGHTLSPKVQGWNGSPGFQEACTRPSKV